MDLCSGRISLADELRFTCAVSQNSFVTTVPFHIDTNCFIFLLIFYTIRRTVHQKQQQQQQHPPASWPLTCQIITKTLLFGNGGAPEYTHTHFVKEISTTFQTSASCRFYYALEVSNSSGTSLLLKTRCRT